MSNRTPSLLERYGLGQHSRLNRERAKEVIATELNPSQKDWFDVAAYYIKIGGLTIACDTAQALAGAVTNERGSFNNRNGETLLISLYEEILEGQRHEVAAAAARSTGLLVVRNTIEGWHLPTRYLIGQGEKTLPIDGWSSEALANRGMDLVEGFLSHYHPSVAAAAVQSVEYWDQQPLTRIEP
jgi:hypothetical protein